MPQPHVTAARHSRTSQPFGATQRFEADRSGRCLPTESPSIPSAEPLPRGLTFGFCLVLWRVLRARCNRLSTLRRPASVGCLGAVVSPVRRVSCQGDASVPNGRVKWNETQGEIRAQASCRKTVVLGVLRRDYPPVPPSSSAVSGGERMQIAEGFSPDLQKGQKELPLGGVLSCYPNMLG